ncbi:elongin-B-like isoform X4 [Cyprinus carpio]|uniref:Elongin-B n=1 Tax=Cyprinus carpio TaxID=7962 RepID=A0A9R0B5K5_CYPCA|nr:elongin-B-like isoform X4 [Cyprinus carpio]
MRVLGALHCGIVAGGEWMNGDYRTTEMDVFLMIRRHKTTIFTDAKESTTIYELKRIVEGILKRSPEEQRLYKLQYYVFQDEQPLEDSKTLGDSGFTNQTARPQAPGTVGLAFRISESSV